MKLKTLIVDDDPLVTQVIKDMCKHSTIVDIIETYTDPVKFVDASKELQYDLCLLDIEMPVLDGITVAKKIDGKPIIFITGKLDMLKDALLVPHMDVIVKPIVAELLEMALDKTFKCIAGKGILKTHEFFRVAESKERMNICLPDILVVKTDEIDSRNKKIILKNGKSYILMDYSFEEILSMSSHLIKVNRTHLISLDAVKSFSFDIITIKAIGKKARSFQITLSDTCRKYFAERMTIY